MHGSGGIGGTARFATGNEIFLPDAASHSGERKSFESAEHVAAGVAIREAAHEDLIEGCPGNHAELAQPGNGSGKAPVGDTDSHAPLNDYRQLDHPVILSQ